MIRAFAVLGLLVAGLAACNDEAKLDYVEKNIAVWHSLPLYPGAVIYQQGNSEYRDGEAGPVIGWTTDVTYDVPPGTTAEDVIAFYVQELSDEWNHCATNETSVGSLSPDGQSTTSEVLVERFVRGDSGVVVATFGLTVEGGNSYELFVDHDVKVDPCVGFPIVG